MTSKKISKALLERLPGYLNYLKNLPEHTTNISAKAIAEALSLGEVSVRKDLAKVSNGGRCKVGHQRETLIADIEAFLDYSNVTNAILVGAGKLGQALLDYGGFEKSGLDILVGFDVKPPKNRNHAGKPILPMSHLPGYCSTYDVAIGIICVPGAQAQSVCDLLVSCGIKAIWNFAPVHLDVPEGVLLQNENLAVSLAALRIQMKPE